VGRNEIGNEVLFFARLTGIGIKQLAELFEYSARWFSHHFEYGFRNVLRGYLQMSTGVFLGNFGYIGSVSKRQVHPYTAGYEEVFHAGHATHLFHEADQFAVVGVKICTNSRVNA